MAEHISRDEVQDEARTRRARILTRLADRVIGLTIAAVLIALLYVLYGLVTGDFIAWPKSVASNELLSAQSQARMAGNAELAANVILIGSILATLIAIARWGWVAGAAYVCGAWGLLLYFLGPWGLSISLASAGKPANEITDLLGRAFQATSQVVLILVMLRLVVGAVHSLMVGRKRTRVPVELTLEAEEAEEPKPKVRRSLLRKCWELSACPTELREYCPVYEARSACWRKGQGCLCDPLFWDRIMEKAERLHGVASTALHRQTRQRMRRQVQMDMSGAARRARCRACPLYNEHQQHKYSAFFWLAYPVTAGVVVALMPVIHVGYTMLATVLQKLVSGTAFLPNREPEFKPFLSVVLETRGIEFVVVLAVAFVIVSYLLELTEYLVYDVKI